MKHQPPAADSTPLYRQIHDAILKKIREKEWLPNQKIPSEHELSEQFGVSRITVRGALAQLTKEGIIYKIRGKGTFIRQDAQVPHTQPLHLTPIREPRLVALLLPRLDNRFTAHVTSGIEDELAKNDYHLVVCKTHDSKEEEKKKLLDMVGLGVHGIIVYPVADESYNEEILKLTLNRFPLVVVDRYLRGVETNCVCADNVHGAWEATRHLLDLGHRNIAFITSQKQTTSLEDRLAGYQKALSESGIPFDSRLQLSLDFQQGKAGQDIKRELQRFFVANPHVTACFAAHYLLAFHIVEALHDNGMTVPDNMSVLCFDDWEGSEFSQMPFTYVDQQEYRLGVESAKLLLSQIQSADLERRKVIIPTTLNVRASTAAPIR